MKILYVTHFFPPRYTTGTENYTLGLARGFLARGHDVRVACADDWQRGNVYWNGVKQDKLDGLEVWSADLNWMKASDPNRVLYDSHLAEKWLDGLLEDIQPDIVHVTSTYSLGVGVLRSVKRARIPLVLTLMDFWFLCPRTVLLRGDGSLCNGRTTPWECQQCLLADSGLYARTKRLPPRLQQLVWDRISDSPVFSRLRGARGMALDVKERKMLLLQAFDQADLVISHSRWLQSVFAGAGNKRTIVYLPNGHDLAWTAPLRKRTRTTRVRLGYMGQISPMKGVHLLVSAFCAAGLSDSAVLDIWGDLNQNRDYADQLERSVASTPSIAFRGRFDRQQLSEVLSNMDVLVVPSLWYENSPLVIQEAFAAGVPVIATRLGGMAEAVADSVCGLLFERGDEKDLSRQLRRIVDEPGLLDRLRSSIPPVKTIEEELGELETLYADLSRR